MKLTLISDLHGNAAALREVIEREPNDSILVQLGDIHGLNSQPKEVVTMLRRLEPQSAAMLAGNHCRAIFHEGEGHVNSDELSRFEKEHTLSQLSQEDIEWMRSLPHLDIFESDSERICATHAMPWPEQASGYESGNSGVTKRDLVGIASVVGDDYSIVISGHTHQQYEQDCSKFGHDVHMINPGSLGYDGNYSTLDTETGEVELKSVEFDEESIKEHIRSVLPDYCPPVRKWY